MSARFAARFIHPARHLAELPGAAGQEDAALASWYGLSPSEYGELRRGFEAATRRAALRLARSAAVRAGLEALPGRIVALGDSLTADALSWAEILQRALELVPTVSDVRLVNLAVAGDSTVHLVSRLGEVFSAAPDLVIVMAGTNDARRHGTAAEAMLVSDRETERNLALLVSLLRGETEADVVLVTPPPVLDERIARNSRFADERVSWRSADLARKAALVAAAHDRVIDSRAVLRPPLERLLLADGLHLSLRGQERLARWIARGAPRSAAAPRGRSARAARRRSAPPVRPRLPSPPRCAA